jgi:diguanylate cyclase
MNGEFVGKTDIRSPSKNMPDTPPIISAEDLTQALQKGELSLHYQPIVQILNRRLIGFEALMRWQHPIHGPISPGQFIPLAETTGLIVDMSKWALRQACRTLKRIEGRTGRNEALYMSVNFTARDFSEDTFIFDLYNIISESDILPEQIQLEITEDLFVRQPDTALSALTMCQKAGMRISVDDCATTAHDLNYLNKFPLNSVKIDQTYIRKMLADPETSRVVAWIIKSAEDLGKTPIAEGVETREEAEALLAIGCKHAQGYYYSRPLPEKELVDYILRPKTL